MNIVLVHGGWHGGWVWQDVASRLRQQGHRVYAPSLTGLAERAHLIDAVQGPDTHVEDIIRLIEFHDLSAVTLVGHSYGGMVITGVAARLPARLASLVYLDAFVPTQSGMPAHQMANPERVREIEQAIQPDGTLLPTGFDRWSASEERRRWLKTRCTPHPANCFTKGVTLSGEQVSIRHKIYVLCESHKPSPFWQFHDRYVNDPAWRVYRLPCLHDAMIDMPQAVVDIIIASQENV